MLASLRGNQWMIREDQIMNFALSSLDATERSESKREEGYYENFFNMRQPAVMDADKVAHIQVVGALMSQCPPIYEKLGLATRYSTIISEMNAAVSQGAVGILFHINSPGGTVTGNVEACQEVMNLPVPTASHCVGLACSAAYKFASGTGAIVASPSAEVGNIGTILAWDDCTEFWKEMGIEFKAITSEGASLKSTFHLEPNAEQLAFLQESVNQAGESFRDHVTAGRTKAGAELDPEIWKAGWYSGQKAGALGLIDDIGDENEAKQLLLSMVS